MATTDSREDPRQISAAASTNRRPYEKPAILDRGRLVEVALGGSPGTGDSGGGALVEDPLS